jgi:hypothetical protein
LRHRAAAQVTLELCKLVESFAGELESETGNQREA